MIFECLDCPFSHINLVVLGLHNLILTFFLFQVLFDSFGCLIICDVESRFVLLVFEFFKDIYEGFEDGCISGIFDGSCKDVVAVIVVGNEVVLVSIQGSCG